MDPILKDSNILVANLLGKIQNNEELQDKNCIKVVCNLNNDALYFSRELIPTRDNTGTFPTGKQVCVIPFRRDFLLKYTKMTPTPLEIAESIDMLRILEHGLNVRMVPTDYDTHAVDNPEDIYTVESLMGKLTNIY